MTVSSYAAFHIMMISKRVNNNNADGTNPKQSLPHASFCLPSVSFSKVHRKLEDFMNRFITKYAPKKKEKLIQKRQQEDENDTTSNCSSSNNEDFVAVENPVRLKGSHELEGKNKNSKEHLEIPKGRKPTQCKQCQNTGHNRAGCEAWHQWQGIPYSY
ncbi:15285_t:CDS:2 [Gigaspora rosea]|nr:15285_t:CDS:2 [Gigaspora rosea]